MNTVNKYLVIGIPATIATISVCWAMKRKKPLDIKRGKQANTNEFNTSQAATEFEKKLLDLLDSELSCSICYEVFVEPVRLPCLHAFCKGCILQMEEIKRKCPLCRATYKLRGKDTLLAGCIQKIIESAYNENEMNKRDELVAARKDLESLMKERKKKKRRTVIVEEVYDLGSLILQIGHISDID